MLSAEDGGKPGRKAIPTAIPPNVTIDSRENDSDCRDAVDSKGRSRDDPNAVGSSELGRSEIKGLKGCARLRSRMSVS